MLPVREESALLNAEGRTLDVARAEDRRLRHPVERRVARLADAAEAIHCYGLFFLLLAALPIYLASAFPGILLVYFWVLSIPGAPWPIFATWGGVAALGALLWLASLPLRRMVRSSPWVPPKSHLSDLTPSQRGPA